MREFKFRAWDGEKMVYFEGGSSVQPLIDFDGNLMGKIKSGSILMQYAGFKDKNHKEVYEGDRVRMKITFAMYPGQPEDEMEVWYETGVVEFSSGCFWINTRKDNGTSGHSINCHFHYNDEDREVIGNIFETPELIKDKQNA